MANLFIVFIINMNSLLMLFLSFFQFLTTNFVCFHFLFPHIPPAAPSLPWPPESPALCRPPSCRRRRALKASTKTDLGEEKNALDAFEIRCSSQLSALCIIMVFNVYPTVNAVITGHL